MPARQGPVHVAEERRAVTRRKVVAPHVVVVDERDERDQSTHEERGTPLLVDVPHLEEEENRGGHHGHAAHEEREAGDRGDVSRIAEIHDADHVGCEKCEVHLYCMVLNVYNVHTKTEAERGCSMILQKR